jgi:hypothetical protein
MAQKERSKVAKSSGETSVGSSSPHDRVCNEYIYIYVYILCIYICRLAEEITPMIASAYIEREGGRMGRERGWEREGERGWGGVGG